MLRNLLGIPSKKYNYKNNYTKYSSKKIKFYGQFEPQVDEFIFNRYFNDTNIKGVCIECGAYDEITNICYKFFEETIGQTCYNFEPNNKLFSLLKNNRPNSINLNLALSNTEEEKTYFEIEYDKTDACGNIITSNSTLEMPSKERLEELKKLNYKINNFSVKTITYKNFIEKYDIKFINLFVLDVEGHEFSVLKGMQNCNILPNIMVIELSDINKFLDLRKIMNSMDYIYDTTSFCDYFFIKKTV